jgi:hypothetical protein
LTEALAAKINLKENQEIIVAQSVGVIEKLLYRYYQGNPFLIK